MQNVNYSEKLKRRFTENGGKLFFVDGSKARAFSAVSSILAPQKPASFLCVTANASAAKQIKSALGKQFDLTVIDSFEKFERLYREINDDVKNAMVNAGLFKAKFPYVLVTLSSDDGAVLNREIGKTAGKAGEYNDGDAAGYCISDFLTSASYDTVVVDEVYKMFDFSVVDRERVESMIPQKYERIDLFGNVYFTGVCHSYKKLSRLVDSAERAIVISDVIVDRDIISLYAGLSLVHTGFSYKEAKAFAASHARDIIAEIDEVCGSASYCPSDSTILSLCLQRAKGSNQIVPSDLETLGDYFTGNLNFMTQEEKFLRIIYSQAKKKFSMNVASNEVIIRTLDNDATIAGAFCDVFFDDEVKGDIEKSLTTSHVAKMTAEEVGSMLEIFQKYAELCDFCDIENNCRVIRIYHEDSGFEDLVRRSRPKFDRIEDSYSASYRGDDMIFKCIAVKNLRDSGELKLPLLIVSNDKSSAVCEQLRKVSGINTIEFDPSQSAVGADQSVVMTYDDLGAVANYMDFGSVVFYDVIADINLLDTYVKKALDLGKNCNAVVLSTYDNISGLLIDMWQDSWFDSKNKVLPIRNTEVYIKGDTALDYNNVVCELDVLYESYKGLVDGSYNGDIKELAKEFSEAISEFTLNVSTPIGEICSDFDYFRQISGHYANVFANSMSIATEGRAVFAEKRGVPVTQKRKPKNAKTPYEVEYQKNTAIFNICSKQLHETCDYKNNDCVSCQYFGKYMINDLALFTSSVKGFFKETVRIMNALEKQKLRDRMNLIINSMGDDSTESDVTIDDIKYASKEANTALDVMLSKRFKNSDGIYYVDYSLVFDVRELVQSIYSKLFGKYYKDLIKIFDKATNKMQTAFETAAQSAKQSLGTL